MTRDEASVAIDDAFQSASQHLAAGRVQEAAAAYRQILERVPQQADALNNLGVIAHQAGRHEECVELITKALLADSSNPHYHANLGAAQHALNRLDDAIAAYSRAAALAPADARILTRLGALYLEKGMAEEAAAALQSAVAGSPDLVGLHILLGRSLERSGRWSRLIDAAAAYRQAIALAPDCADAHYCLACCLKRQHNLDESIVHYRRALESVPDFPLAIAQCGDALRRHGKLTEAIDMARSLIPLEQNEDFPYFMAAELMAECGLLEDAQRQLHICIERAPEKRQRAQQMLAALGLEPLPAKTPESLLRERYDKRAHVYDQMFDGSMAAGRPYRAPEMVAQALRELCGESARLDILDIGCGTGLVGTLVRGIARRLDGVDLSPPSLAKAAEKQIYDELTEGDLVAFAASRHARYDAVTAAGILIHFNDLQPVFEAVASSLRDGGVFVFTAYPDESEAAGSGMAARAFFDLVRSGCYPHSKAAICEQAEAAGFAIERLRLEAGEYINGEPIATLLVALRRRIWPALETRQLNAA